MSEKGDEKKSPTQKELHEEDPEKYSDEDDEEEEEVSGAELPDHLLREMMRLRVSAGEQKEKPKVLDDVSLKGIADYIKSGKAGKIITMAGAGISTSAGIPDFRSPGSGLYDNLQKYNLPNPQVRNLSTSFLMLFNPRKSGNFNSHAVQSGAEMSALFQRNC